MRTGRQALDWAKDQHQDPTRDWTRDCMMFVRSAFHLDGRYGSAILGWYNTDHRHTSWPPPAAVPVWFAGGSFGHVMLSIGDATGWGNDMVRRGKIDRTALMAPVTHWNYRYLGWSEDINDVRVYVGPKIIDISNVIYAARNHKAANHGIALKRAVAAEVGRGEMSYDTHTLGKPFRVQYRKLQHKWYGGGAAADGIPGPTSLHRLCKKHDLLVRP